MINDQELQNRLNSVFRSVFDDDSLEVTDTMTASDVEEWDSLNHINLVVMIEKEFRVKFTLHEVNSLKNVGDLKTLLRKHGV